MTDLDQLWDLISEKFKTEMYPVSYETWIEPAKALKVENQRIYIEVPQDFHKEYWENNLSSKVIETLYEATGQEIIPVIQTPSQNKAQREIMTANAQSRRRAYKDSQLNPKYTFETFVIGKGNQMAHAAALAVAEYPGTTYNPLFFYGGVGLGKTHLMHAIGNYMQELDDEAVVKYVTSETFTNDFIRSIQTNTQEKFRQEYRTVDLLLVDDIQFFGDKEGIQGEFFHTFNELYNNQKQIVLTSDRLPNEIPKLEERLVSRFGWGLPVDITPPDLETRIAILRNKADSDNIVIPDDTLSYIAGQIDSNVRELEGALMRVQAYSAMLGEPISTSLAAQALKSIVPEDEKHQLTIPDIQKEVASYYKLTVDDLKGRKRVREIVVPRQIAMYLSREMTDTSFPKIGAEFGGKDHTTVIHAHEKIGKEIGDNLDLKDEINKLKKRLK